MGAAGTFVLHTGILDSCQSFPQFIRLNVCHHQKHIFLNVESRVTAIQDSNIDFLFSRSDLFFVPVSSP